MASQIIRMIPQILNEGSIKLFKSYQKKYADGDQQRDFIYVKDVAAITCSFLDNKACGIFNVGTGIPSTWNQLARAVFKALKKPVEISYIPMPEDLQGKYQYYTVRYFEDGQSFREAV